MKIRTDGDFSIKPGKFEGTLESLTSQFVSPEWYKDAKIGFWSHWGPQSVPMYGDWYARRMYLEDDPVALYHRRKYGHPSKFGYKDLIPLWKAEKFDPDALADLFYRAGARYLMAQAVHHDNFDNFDSKYQPNFNSVKMGPHRDIVGDWKKAAEKKGMRFGISEHLAGSPGFYYPNKGCDVKGKYKGVPYDGADPAYTDLYYDQTVTDTVFQGTWFLENEDFYKHWFLRMKDAIDKYTPDFYYTDGPVPCGHYGFDLVAHLYNTSAAIHGENEAVFFQKDKTKSVFPLGVLDIERNHEDRITPYQWQTCTSIGDWFYNVRDVYKTWEYLLETIIDNVSKNGNILLNVPQLPDGTVDEECSWILEKMAEWMAVNGEGIFGTRAWKACGEGPNYTAAAEEEPEATRWEPAHVDESEISWQPGDVRFTSKGNLLYAFLMRWPGELAILRSLPLGQGTAVKAELLGGGELPFRQTSAGLLVDLPAGKAGHCSCLKITLQK